MSYPMGGNEAEAEAALARTIAVSAYRAFRYAMHNKGPRGQELPSWEFLPSEAQDGWFGAVFAIRVATEEVDRKQWSDIAAEGYKVYARAIGKGAPEWKDLPHDQWLAWGAAARHIFNLFEADELTEDDIETQEAAWSTWADKRNGV